MRFLCRLAMLPLRLLHWLFVAPLVRLLDDALMGAVALTGGALVWYAFGVLLSFVTSPQLKEVLQLVHAVATVWTAAKIECHFERFGWGLPSHQTTRGQRELE
jgi:hypothetical protein